MKKLILFLFVAFFCLIIQAQNRPILFSASTTLQGVDADTITLNIMPGLDYLSVQFVPALAGSGDSLTFTYVPEVSNQYSGSNFTDLAAAATVSSALGDTDAVVTYTPLQWLRLRYIITGVSTDTCTVTVYGLQKQ